ncbi:MAG TPA: CPBP family intramembrane glutamic endopeptidase [Armatimonadota bacterium]|nr:CPBP family intramembrane glutamic endopeptidase [Armatimonadota bacterium]
MSIKSNPAGKSVIACITITYVLSWAWLAILMLHGGYKGLGWVGPFVFMWIPGLCSLACRLLFREGFRDIGWRWRNWKATLAAVWGPLVVGISAYAILWGTGLAPMHEGNWGISFGGSAYHQQSKFALLYFSLIALAIMTPVVSPFSLGEELCWRGYLLDRMVKSGMRRPVFTLGLVWAVWHLPVLLTGQYLKTSHLAVTVLFFILMILGSNSVICRLRLQSASIWIPVLMHSVHNVAFQNILQPATVENQWHTFLGGECGALTVVAYGILAWLVWRRSPKSAKTGVC